MKLTDLLVETHLAVSKGEAKRLVMGGGIYINDERCTNLDREVTIEDAIDEKVIVLRRGAKNVHLVKVLGSNTA